MHSAAVGGEKQWRDCQVSACWLVGLQLRQDTITLLRVGKKATRRGSVHSHPFDKELPLAR